MTEILMSGVEGVDVLLKDDVRRSVERQFIGRVHVSTRRIASGNFSESVIARIFASISGGAV